MGVAVKLRWKQIINQLRYLHEELELVESISGECAGLFQTYYEEYCAHHNLDLAALHTQHADRVHELFGKPEPTAQEEPDFQSICDGSLVVRDKRQPSLEFDPTHELSLEEQAFHDSFRKIFLKLALLFHPDKIDSSLSAEAQKNTAAIFQKVKDAFEERKYFILLDYAEKFNIAVPKNYKQQIKWMKKEITQLEKEVQQEKTTYNYGFAECETDEERDRLVHKFLWQVFGYDVVENS